eukprot:SAG31_NODE_1010_length_10388_cov_3.740014_6_plen_102_part_00
MAAMRKKYKKPQRGVGRKIRQGRTLNRQEPWFLGRDYSQSFVALHQMNKYNHAVEGFESYKKYTGRENELKKLQDHTRQIGHDYSNRLTQFDDAQRRMVTV